MHNHYCNDFYGTSTVGERGQIVIPSEARHKLKISSGDKFVFFSHGQVLHLIKADVWRKCLKKSTKILKQTSQKLKIN